MDLQENPGTNTVMATFELPGMDGSDVSIDVDNNVLTVSGMSKISGQTVDHGHVVRERRLGRFSRSFALPQGVTVSVSLAVGVPIAFDRCVMSAKRCPSRNVRRRPHRDIPQVHVLSKVREIP